MVGECSLNTSGPSSISTHPLKCESSGWRKINFGLSLTQCVWGFVGIIMRKGLLLILESESHISLSLHLARVPMRWHISASVVYHVLSSIFSLEDIQDCFWRSFFPWLQVYWISFPSCSDGNFTKFTVSSCCYHVLQIWLLASQMRWSKISCCDFLVEFLNITGMKSMKVSLWLEDPSRDDFFFF